MANFDMTDLNQNCPDGFVQVNNADPPLRLCGRPGPIGCSSMFFAVNGTEYSKVCGRVKAYQHGTPDALGPSTSNVLIATMWMVLASLTAHLVLIFGPMQVDGVMGVPVTQTVIEDQSRLSSVKITFVNLELVT